jgi:hypothetical protein
MTDGDAESGVRNGAVMSAVRPISAASVKCGVGSSDVQVAR